MELLLHGHTLCHLLDLEINFLGATCSRDREGAVILFEASLRQPFLSQREHVHK